MYRPIAVSITCLLFSACSFVPSKQPSTPQTQGALASATVYVPLDGLPVKQTYEAGSCKEQPNSGTPTHRDLVSSLPDISSRFAVSENSGGGNIGFGPATITGEGRTYKAIIDYVNNDTVPVSFIIRKVNLKGDEIVYRTLAHSPGEREETVGYEAKTTDVGGSRIGRFSDMTEADFRAEMEQALKAGYTEITLPIFIGIGLRVTADIESLKSNLSISSLGAISANIDQLEGGLTVQTIGVSGSKIGSIIPSSTNLDNAGIQQALLTVGAGRTIVYSATQNDPGLSLTPRVVGLNSTIGSDPALINAIYSELIKVRPEWHRPCEGDGGADQS